VFDPALLQLREGGRILPLQSRPLERWSDGSVRWALLDFRADAVAGEAVYDLGITKAAQAVPRRDECAQAVRPSRRPEVDVGPWILCASGRPQLSLLFVSNTSARTPLAEADVEILDVEGRTWPVLTDCISLEESGPLRSRVAVTGRARCPRTRRELRLTLRIDLYPGLPVARVDAVIRNPDRARHLGGVWELGDKGSVLLKDVAFRLRLSDPAPNAVVACSLAAGEEHARCGSRLELYQESSGRPNWRSTNHVNARGEVPLRFPGFVLKSEAGQKSGPAATPAVVLSGGQTDLVVTVPEFWQNFPKALEASSRGIVFRLFPGRFGDAHEIQGGEQKTHRFWVAVGTDPVADIPLDWCRNPLAAAAEPEWYCTAEALPFLTPAACPDDSARQALVRAALDGNLAFECQRDVIDEYGWRHFGDVYANHEAVGHAGPQPLVSHYNNQYDIAMGLAGQFMATADCRWFRLMDELVRHVVDIDIYHTARDKAAFNGGLFWHTFHYVDAGRSSHRSYPKAPGVNGGGPSNEHCYSTGLLLHYFLTGDTASRDTAVGLANWVIDMDDGRKTVFRWLARGRTGLASMTADTAFHGPGRGPGNAVAALLNAQRLTGERRFLEKAEELVRRCVHPHDDIAGLHLLDAERRWSYTVFLQQLGKYLMHKAERGELDRSYGYARAALLHYARWMAASEYPYLDKPEILEYPTETWAAQDIRKSDVLCHAALHATGAERSRFAERARFFFDYSVSTLAGMPTRALARPLAIMLTSGVGWAWLLAHPGAALPPPVEAAGFGEPVAFVPQKAIALRRAKALAAAGGAVLLLGAGLLLAALLRR
jgi:hypothetical protein